VGYQIFVVDRALIPDKEAPADYSQNLPFAYVGSRLQIPREPAQQAFEGSHAARKKSMVACPL